MYLSSYFKQAIEQNASDLYLVGGSAPTLRVQGELVKLSDDKISGGELEQAVFSLIYGKGKEKFKREKELDISQEFFGVRFRINFHFQEGNVGLAARFIPSEIPSPGQLGLDEGICKFTRMQDGLIIVTGPSGSGKSTTLASMINIINKESKAHIITIEDPIEFLFKEEQSIIEQRGLGDDTKSFASALKHALRQNPDVIMVGEMRDPETISLTLTIAETGHLALSTLHTPTASEAIARIVDVFPGHQQRQILVQLASIMRVVIAQQLLPKKGGGLVAAREIMINNRAIANLIKANRIGQIDSIIQTNASMGMITMNKSIDILYSRGLISEEVARNHKRDSETLAVYH